MTREEYIREQFVKPDELLGYNVVPCLCSDPCCPKWQTVNVSELPEADVWLDDLGPDDVPFSRPVPDGFLHVRTQDEFKALFASYRIRVASLDHDLGACKDCIIAFLAKEFIPKWAGMDPAVDVTEQARQIVESGNGSEAWIMASQGQTMPHCEHTGSGYDLCLWMAEHGIWPSEKPVVHSANTVGAERMRGVIDRYFPESDNASEQEEPDGDE